MQRLSDIIQSRCISRRALVVASAVSLVWPDSGFAQESVSSSKTMSPGQQDQPLVCTLGFSTYGMKTMSTERALAVLQQIGYDAVELAVRRDWDADSANLSQSRRMAIRRQIDGSRLRLTSLMEHVSATSEKHQEVALDRLKRAAEVAHDLSPVTPPIIQTVLGGGDFLASRTALRDRLGVWVQLAETHNVTIAFKPHRGGVVSQPVEAVWLIDQLGAPERLRMVYDYSHYAFRDLPLEQTVRSALPFIAHVAVKDAVQDTSNDKQRVVFELPGAAKTIDFAKLIRQLFDGGYRGDINCEVSGMVSNQTGYDPVLAARTCYENIAKAFVESGVPRPK